MAQAGGYFDELENESKQMDGNSHASRLIKQEIDRLQKGEDEVVSSKTRPPISLIDIHEDKSKKMQIRIRLPVREYPKYNFVGKLLGPKGQNLKDLQAHTGCKMAIMGKGSMRDKDKEEELRKEGGKFAHLDEELHILVECFAEFVDGYHRLAAAAQELKKFVVPQMEEYEEMSGMNGSGMRGGRGGFRGGRGGPPTERGGYRGGRGRDGGPPPPSRGGRGGAPPSRGSRGSSRGGAPPRGGSSRGGSSGSYGEDRYGSQGYSSRDGGYDSNYDGYGSQSYSGGDSNYYDYPSNQGSGYDSYSGYDYGESWNAGGGKAATPSGRGSSRGQGRSHPYSRH